MNSFKRIMFMIDVSHNVGQSTLFVYMNIQRNSMMWVLHYSPGIFSYINIIL